MPIKSKSERIITLHADCENTHESTKWKFIASALYVSASETKHFYEALQFLAETYPDAYGEEFLELKNSYL